MLLSKWVKVSENHDKKDFKMVGVVKKLKSKAEEYNANDLKRKLNFIMKIDEDLKNIGKMAKKSKRCSHKNTSDIEFHYKFETKTVVEYCSDCKLVLNSELVETERTQTLINLAFAEGRMADSYKNIEELKRKIEEEEAAIQREMIYIDEQKKELK